MSGLEPIMASKWIYDTLAGDGTVTAAATGGLWDGSAPDGTAYPLVRWNAQSPGIVQRGVGTVTIWLNMLWLVRAVCEGTSYEPVVTLAGQIDSLLHGAQSIPVTSPDGMIVVCVREQAFQQEAVQAGKDYRHLGGIYRIIAQQA